MFGSAASAAEGTKAATFESVGLPAGFSELAREHELLVDVFFGGRKVGEAKVIARPGSVRFKDPEAVLRLVPNVISSPGLGEALAGDLPSNADLVCAEGIRSGCGELAPKIAGIIFDEEHFRVDLFIARSFLRLVREEKSPYLETPSAPLSLTSASGVALSGSNQTSPLYNLQNRTVIGFRNARIRSDSSYSSKIGFVMDSLVAEMDRPGLRYSGGLFWAPGLDLIGERRIAGVGVASQFDTRSDHDSLAGTPLILFLSQPARVDMLIDGRLVTSAAYEAGNNLLDTSALPDGSYDLLLRIHEANGSIREERRFFAKNQQIAPRGEPIYFAYAGMLANTREGRPVSLSSNLFYEFGAARRLSDNVALDLSVIGTRTKPMIEAGGWLITAVARVRAAALASTSGDRGGLLQVASGQIGNLSLNFDLRRIYSHDGKPLIPVSNYVDTFDQGSPDERQIGAGSYTQASGSIGYQLGAAYLAVIGSIRKDKGSAADYSVGPSLNWALVNRGGMQVTLRADAQVTRATTAAYIGFNMLFTKGRYSVTSSLGRRSLSSKGASSASDQRQVGDTTAHFSYSGEDGTDLSVAGGLTRELASTTAHAEGVVYSRYGTARGEVLRDFEGDRRMQYGLNLQTGAVLDRDDAVIGGRNLSESALVVRVDGAPVNSEFDVLVNEQPRGRVGAGQRLPIFLQPYRSYSVRLRPVKSGSLWYDSAARSFTLYPGNVQHVRWQVEHLLTLFGRAVRPDGRPVADATIASTRGVGQSDSNGYFQIEAAEKDALSFAMPDGGACSVRVGQLAKQQDYASLGKVLCQ